LGIKQKEQNGEHTDYGTQNRNYNGISITDIKALYIAARTAQKSVFRHKHGSVIYKGHKIISVGYNKNKTHPKALEFYEFPFIHSEFDALLRAKCDVHGYTLVCARVNKYGELMNSKPCDACMAAMRAYGIKTIVFYGNSRLQKVIL
jgi:deoxycytidylate deaminase